MRIICEKSDLLKSINIAIRAVPVRTTMPILECILIEARGNEIRLTANDMDLGIETKVSGLIEETGTLAVEAKMLSEIVRKLPDSAVTIASDKNYTVTITCEKAKFVISGKSDDDFSYLPAVEREDSVEISQFTLIRKDPQYVGRAKEVREYERARVAGDRDAAAPFYAPLHAIGIDTSVEELIRTTGIGSVLYAKRPGDGSAREYAASCQKVLGGLANICIEYATKRYRSNCVNWGILPFTNPEPEIQLEPGEYIYLPGIRKAVEEGVSRFEATVISIDGQIRSLPLYLPEVTEAEKKILLAGSLINSYKL